MAGRIPGLTLDQARTFVALVESRSFALAAVQLRDDASPAATRRSINAAGVRHALTRLTANLGGRPLVSTSPTGMVELTEHGKRVLPEVRRLLRSADALLYPNTNLVLGAFPSIARQLADCFAGEHLPFSFHHSISDATRHNLGQNLLNQLESGEIDLAIAPSGNGVSKPFQEKELYAWRLRALVRPSDRNAVSTSITLQELSEYRLIVAGSGHLSRIRLESASVQEGSGLNIAHEINDQDLARAMVGLRDTSGRGFAAVMPDDAFGFPEAFGPLVHSLRAPIGGTYSLYWRVDSGDARSAAVRSVAQDLLEHYATYRSTRNDGAPTISA